MSATETPPADAQAQEPEAEPKEPTAGEKVQADLDKLRPRTETVRWTFSLDDRTETYYQRPLSWINKLRFVALIGETIDDAMQGEKGLTFDGIAGLAGGRGGMAQVAQLMGMSGERALDNFMQGLAKLTVLAPNFLLDSYCLWLAVPEGDWPWAKFVMSLPAEDGGLSDEDGMVMIETFIDQNAEALRDLLVERFPAMGKRVQDRFKLEAPASSKPSKRSGRAIRRNR